MSEPDISQQRFNHIAMTVSEDQLSTEGCDELLAFYRGVFGWTEMPGLKEIGKILVLRAHSNEQFVFIVAGAEPMRCGQLDHFGLSVPQPEDLDELLARATRYQEKDDRVQIIEHRPLSKRKRWKVQSTLKKSTQA